MFSRLFKNFKLWSRCSQNDVDVCIKFMIHENRFFLFFISKKFKLRVFSQANSMNFDRSCDDAIWICQFFSILHALSLTFVRNHSNVKSIKIIKIEMNSSFLQMNFFNFKIFIELDAFFLVQMIFFVTINTFNRRWSRDFIAEKCEEHIRKQHVLRRHILKKHREWFWIEHERLIWRKIARRHIRLIILTRFRIVSITWEKNTIYQIVNVDRHFSHDFDQVVEFDINFWDRFFDSRFHCFQQIDEMLADVLFHNRFHFFHQRCRFFRFVICLSRLDNDVSRFNQLQNLFYQIFETHFVLVIFI